MQTLVARDVGLARVVDHRGTSYFGGLYGRSLAPADADRVVDVMRSKLRVREDAAAAEPLRDPELGRFLIRQWMDAVRESDGRMAHPPELQNTDGDSLLFVTELSASWKVAGGDRETARGHGRRGTRQR